MSRGKHCQNVVRSVGKCLLLVWELANIILPSDFKSRGYKDGGWGGGMGGVNMTQDNLFVL